MTVYLKCSECGDGLKIFERRNSVDYNGDITAEVEPCKTCRKASYDEGYEAAETNLKES